MLFLIKSLAKYRAEDVHLKCLRVISLLSGTLPVWPPSGDTACGNFTSPLGASENSYLLSSVLPQLIVGLEGMPLTPELDLNNVSIGTQCLWERRLGDEMSCPRFFADTLGLFILLTDQRCSSN